MKTSISLVSVLLGICLTGVQADLPYNMPEWRRDSPPILPTPGQYYPTKGGENHHHHHTATGTGHHHPTSVHLPGHHHPGTGLPGTGHHYPTGVPNHHHHPPPLRDVAHTTLRTVTGTGTGTGGHAHPTGGPWSHPYCKSHADCKSTVCPFVMPHMSPQCVQGRERKFCACLPVVTE
ncbi:hypothetical protein F4818DRAFT_429058 [Hypoxylon cercidicola]|nr:hypothetical protein F4818DRAFT_429058 [Hypoxylon cercidicola]